MRSLCVLLLMVPVGLVPGAADDEKPKATALTAKEIADGWLMLFDGETTFGWKIDGESKIKDKVLLLGGDKEARAETTSSFNDFELRFDVHTGGEKAMLSFGNNVQSFKSTRWGTYSVKCKGNAVDSESQGIDESSGEGRGGRPIATPLRFQVPAGGKLQLKNIKLKPLGLNSIFNGKDLAGWKEIPNKKSKFTVTGKGELNIKDGPGDLQTEGQWDD